MNARTPLPLDTVLSRDELVRLALSCGIAQSLCMGDAQLVRGLDEEDFAALQATLLPGSALRNGTLSAEPFDEFEDVLGLLMDHAAARDAQHRWVACAVSTAAQRDNHLWQDMGLPSRRELSALMQACFPRLAEKNVKDMKWKKFFYRELCQRAGVPICKSPNCADCCDVGLCFGPEE